MVSNGLAIIQDEPDSTELVGCGSTSHVCGLAHCRVGNAVLQELIHGPFGPQGAPAVMRKSLYENLSAVGSPSTLQDKRSAIDVLIIRESVMKTGCVIRWAPTGLQLVDGLTNDKGEAVECLRQSLRSGSYMHRCDEQVIQERHMVRVSKGSASDKSPTVEQP